MNKMHANELEINLDLVRGLICEQFPEFSSLDITAVNSIGTVNRIYKLGPTMCIRLPRLIGSHDLEKESKWLPHLQSYLPLRIPAPIAKGQSSSRYPANWSIYDWIEGSEYSDDLVHNEEEAALSLAAFVNAMQAIEVPPEAPPAGRLPLLELDGKTYQAIAEIEDLLDTDEIIAAWKISSMASAWNGEPVWIHADLLRSNLLLNNQQLAAVIDFGSAGIGDPAFDLIPAWTVFNAAGRGVFRNAIRADHDTWLRARGYALHQALLIIPYYQETNPRFVSQAKRTINEILFEINNSI